MKNILYKILNFIKNIFYRIFNNSSSNVSEYIQISDDIKIDIASIIRPVIKEFNSISEYLELCNSLGISPRVLKTFASLSEDKQCIILNFTANSSFNRKLGTFVKNIVAQRILETLQEKYPNIDIDDDNGSIIIRLKKI